MMKSGTQIAYIPRHAQNSPVLLDNITNPDVELGFVTGICGNGTAHFCRYWSRYEKNVLRTRANSESTPDDCLIEYQSVDQKIVDKLIAELYPAAPNDSRDGGEHERNNNSDNT